MAPRTLRPGIRIRTVDGTAGDDPDGNLWGTASVLIKPDTAEAPRGVAAEFISTRLAAAVGLPVPLGEVSTDARERTVWASALVQLDGEQIAPPDIEEVVERMPDLCAGIFVFDVWTLNADRNDENFIYHEQVGLWACDHALGLGQVFQRQFTELAKETQRPLSYHELRAEPLDTAALRRWGDRVQSLSRSAIERLVGEAKHRGLVSTEERSCITQLLLQRQANIHRLVTASSANSQPASDDQGARDEHEGSAPE